MHIAQNMGAAYRRAAPEYDPNRHIENGMDAAQRCRHWLVAEGFTVIKVTVGGDLGRPLIRIQTCAGCVRLVEELGGHPCGFDENGRRWHAVALGCWVEWSERGH